MMDTAPPDAEFTIRDLAEEFGLTARALRFYETKGLIQPRRRGQTRLYTAADRARLALVLRGKRVGFTLDEIREMLDFEKTAAHDATMRELLARMRERKAALAHQRHDIELALRDLEAGCAWLETRIADKEPTPELKRAASAFEAFARARLFDSTGAA